MNRWFALIVLVVLSLSPRVTWAEKEVIVVLVHPESKVTNVSLSELRAIFIGQKRMWPGGESIKPLNLKRGSRERVAFDRLVLGMSPEQVEKFWVDSRIRGKAAAPPEVSSVLLLQRVTAKTKGAVTYARATQIQGGTRVLKIDGLLPDAPNYPLSVE
ncbi:MAG: hypothetical protein AAF658_16955 [Myxococcota bacterium]